MSLIKELKSFNTRVESLTIKETVVDKEESSKQGRNIVDIDADVEVNLENVYNLDMPHEDIVLSMQDVDVQSERIDDVVKDVVELAENIKEVSRGLEAEWNANMKENIDWNEFVEQVQRRQSDVVNEFGDSYEVPASAATTETASDGTGKKSGRTVTVTTEDIQKRKNDINTRTTLLLSLPDEHQLRFSKYKTAQELYAVILKTFGVKKVNDDVQLRALIDGKKVVVSEAIIRRDLHLDDADGVECLPNDEIFEELARMRYEKPPPKLTFYKAFFSAQWKVLIHTLVQCLSAKKTAWNDFSCSMASAIICLAAERKFNFSKYIFDSMVRNVDSPSKFLMYPHFLQVVLDHQVDDMTTHNTRYTSPSLTQKVFANMRIVGKGGNIADIDADEGITLVDVETDEEVVAMDTDVAELIVFDDEDVTMTMAQTLIKLKVEKAKLLDEQIAQKLHDEEVQKVIARDKHERVDIERALELQRQFDDKEENIVWSDVAKQVQERHLDLIRKYQNLKKKPVSIAQAKKNMIIYLKNMVGYKMEFFKGMTYDNVRPIFEREYKKVQTLFKLDKDVQETKKKRVADETLFQESFKKLRAAKVSESKSTQEIPSNDPKEMTEEDVQNMLEIVPVPEFKVEALQLYSDCGVHHVSSTRGHDIFMLTEKDYALSNAVMILMLSGKLQVEEDNKMAKDLVMKIFMEANKPRSRSLDTSS
nr:hypothetical protein [Tanacetum cinerariifolium]